MDYIPIPAPKGRGKIISVLIVIGLIILVIFLDIRRRDANKKLLQYEQSGGNQAQNQEVAKDVTEKVRRLMVIPDGINPTVATIVDVKELQAHNAFYNKAKNGDYLVVTNDRAILYDPVADKIIDVVTVQASVAGSSSSAKKK